MVYIIIMWDQINQSSYLFGNWSGLSLKPFFDKLYCENEFNISISKPTTLGDLDYVQCE